MLFFFIQNSINTIFQQGSSAGLRDKDKRVSRSQLVSFKMTHDIYRFFTSLRPCFKSDGTHCTWSWKDHFHLGLYELGICRRQMHSCVLIFVDVWRAQKLIPHNYISTCVYPSRVSKYVTIGTPQTPQPLPVQEVLNATFMEMIENNKSSDFVYCEFYKPYPLYHSVHSSSVSIPSSILSSVLSSILSTYAHWTEVPMEECNI